MTRAAKTLLEAVTRYPEGSREDRLTEVFATTLEAVSDLAEWLISEARLPPPARGTGIVALTQVARPNGGRPDMLIEYRDAQQQTCGLLVEHKIEAQPTPEQRHRVPTARATRRPPAAAGRG